MKVTRTIRMKFLTDAGKTYTVSLKYASARLEGEEAGALVKKAMETILEINPFNVRLVAAVGAELVIRKEILTVAAPGAGARGSVACAPRRNYTYCSGRSASVRVTAAPRAQAAISSTTTRPANSTGKINGAKPPSLRKLTLDTAGGTLAVTHTAPGRSPPLLLRAAVSRG